MKGRRLKDLSATERLPSVHFSSGSLFRNIIECYLAFHRIHTIEEEDGFNEYVLHVVHFEQFYGTDKLTFYTPS